MSIRWYHTQTWPFVNVVTRWGVLAIGRHQMTKRFGVTWYGRKAAGS